MSWFKGIWLWYFLENLFIWNCLFLLNHFVCSLSSTLSTKRLPNFSITNALCALRKYYEQEEINKVNIKWKLFRKLAIQTLIIFIPKRARHIIRLLWIRMFAILLSLSAERILLSSEQTSIVHIRLLERNFPQISKIPKIESSYRFPSDCFLLRLRPSEQTLHEVPSHRSLTLSVR